MLPLAIAEPPLSDAHEGFALRVRMTGAASAPPTRKRRRSGCAGSSWFFRSGLSEWSMLFCLGCMQINLARWYCQRPPRIDARLSRFSESCMIDAILREGRLRHHGDQGLTRTSLYRTLIVALQPMVLG